MLINVGEHQMSFGRNFLASNLSAMQSSIELNKQESLDFG